MRPQSQRSASRSHRTRCRGLGPRQPRGGLGPSRETSGRSESSVGISLVFCSRAPLGGGGQSAELWETTHKNGFLVLGPQGSEGGRGGDLCPLAVPLRYLHHPCFSATRGHSFSLAGIVGPRKFTFPSNFGVLGDRYPPPKAGSIGGAASSCLFQSAQRWTLPSLDPLATLLEAPG